jgi:hypothetical protein
VLQWCRRWRHWALPAHLTRRLPRPQPITAQGVRGGGAVGGPLLVCWLAPVFGSQNCVVPFCSSSQQGTVLGGCLAGCSFGALIFYSGFRRSCCVMLCFDDDDMIDRHPRRRTRSRSCDVNMDGWMFGDCVGNALCGRGTPTHRQQP